MTVEQELQNAANPGKAKLLQGFFKTGKGEYGEGDVFLGVIVPEQRRIAKRYKSLPLSDIERMMHSKIHEHRMTALFILVDKYKKAGDKKEIFDFYLRNARYVNNWDLVDLSAPNIVGGYLLDKPRAVLYKLAKSRLLWEKRIAVLATFMFIKHNEYEDALRIAEILLKDDHDLIHKAVGWMLREVGKRDLAAEEGFLKKYYRKMPRTMLRYAIEKLSEERRRLYLSR